MTLEQAKSIISAIHMNDYFLTMSWQQIKKLRYRIRPHLLIDAKKIQKSFKTIDWKYSKVGIDISKIVGYDENIDFQSEVLV